MRFTRHPIKGCPASAMRHAIKGCPATRGLILALALVKPDPAVLLRWSARDNDRTALSGAELKVAVP